MYGLFLYLQNCWRKIFVKISIKSYIFVIGYVKYLPMVSDNTGIALFNSEIHFYSKRL